MIPEPSRLRTLLRAELARLGAGRWRVADDVVDAAYDALVDHWVAGRAPRDPGAWCLAVVRNLVKSGPKRADLDLLKVGADPDSRGLPARAGKVGLDLSDRDRELVRGIVDCAWLTEAERAAVDASLRSNSVKKAAARAGMSPRDYRVRIRRASGKLAVELDRLTR